jgi:bacterioferritin
MNTFPYSDEELQHAIEQGPITAAYQADPRAIIEELNRLRATELASFLQYQQHAYMAVSLLAPGLKTAFQAQAALAIQHADVLGERIQQLGGSPVFQPGEITQQAAEEHVQPKQGATLSEMVAENLMIKRRQIAAYTALIRELGDKDLTTRHLLVGLLVATEKQASELAGYLKRSADTRP